MGWFYGFKLHLIVYDEGELLAFQLTPGHVDDRQPVPTLLTAALVGQLFESPRWASDAPQPCRGLLYSSPELTFN
jgi:hypothetical protein